MDEKNGQSLAASLMKITNMCMCMCIYIYIVTRSHTAKLCDIKGLLYWIRKCWIKQNEKNIRTVGTESASFNIKYP